ncbi:MAG: hypothetical protein WC091_24725 [Sulfuricellaceae bacterium]
MNQAQDREKQLRAFYEALDDRPLDPADAKDSLLYEKSLHSGTGKKVGADTVEDLAGQIDWNEGSRVWLFTGDIGTGKSTELRRLRMLLRRHGHVVFLSDARDYINLNQPIEISDLMLSMVIALAGQAGEYCQDDLMEESYLDRLANFLNSKIVFGDATLGLEAGALKTSLKLGLKQDPSFKKKLQDKLQGALTPLRKEIEGYVSEIIRRIKEKDGRDAKIVFLLDSFEQLRGSGEAQDTVLKSVRTLFSQYADMLRFASIQIVYSVPPYLLKLAPQLNAQLGAGTVCHLTTAHIFRRCSREPDSDGVKVFRIIVGKRYRDWESIIPQPVLDRLILSSGGDLRDFFRLLRIYLQQARHGADPTEIAAYAENHLRRDMTWITEPHRDRLRHVAERHQPRLNSDSDTDQLVHDLETKRVLMYRNGDDWYDVHPLLRDYVASNGAAEPRPPVA